MKLFNTMTRKVEEFVPLKDGEVGLYCCGPTVYNYAHIGNLRTYIFEDTLHRVLVNHGYKLNHVMNITDVGHLTGDGDDGEDKLKKRSREEGKSVYEIADFYTKAFFEDEEKLNIICPNVTPKATDHIGDMISLIKVLEEKGHTYTSNGNVYFSIESISDYGKLSGQNNDEKLSGARIEVDKAKKNPKDFVLWFTNSKFPDQAMTWDSPWGRGYPGWHIECSAMSMKYLGPQFDIHCGGVDAIPVHHTNEIAQSEAATGKKWVNYWCHGEFLINDSGKMSKSTGDFLTLTSLIDKGYDPLDYRYFVLTGHYRTQLKFSYEALSAARSAREKLTSFVLELKRGVSKEGKAAPYYDNFLSSMENDLKTPEALSFMWKMIKDSTINDEDKLYTLLKMDDYLGLGLRKVEKKEEKEDIPSEILSLLDERNRAKKEKNYSLSDKIRDELKEKGYTIKDTPSGSILEKV